MVEKKRARPASAAVEKQTKRQRNRAALAAKPTYHKPKPSNPLIDTPLEDLLPHQRIDLIAELSESILEDPQSAVSSSRTTLTNSSESEHQYQKTQSKLQKLIELSSPSTNGHDATSARLGLLSLLAIFTDILPSYRIRLPTESEMAVRVSKEIKQTWDYERKLLMYYQRYLQLLEGMWEKGRHGSGLDGTKNGSPTTLAATSILCLSQLLQTCYNFNFRTNLLQIVVRQGNHPLEEVRGSCCNALRVMFAKDVQGEASLEAVKRMAKMVKEQRGRVHCDLLNT
jgi:nucleolar complex protein 3